MSYTPPALAALNAQSPEGFIEALAGIFDQGRWVAEAIVGWRPFADVGELYDAMAAVVSAASHDDRLALLRGSLGLEAPDAGTPATGAERMRGLNARFRGRFGIPFIFAHAADSDALLAAYARRWGTTETEEEAAAMAETLLIARRRLDLLLTPQCAAAGRLSVQVIDTLTGRPAAGVALTLSYVADIGRRHRAAEAVTNADGETDSPLLAGAELTAGRYSLDVGVAAYFREQGAALTDPPFLDVVTVAFGLPEPGARCRLSLMISPNGYSAQRSA